jgi:hypothetical protein
LKQGHFQPLPDEYLIIFSTCFLVFGLPTPFTMRLVLMEDDTGVHSQAGYPPSDLNGCVAYRPGKGLIIPADGLMAPGELGSIIPHPPGMKNMFKKIALCAMLVLFLAPAAVMAAGSQGQAQGIGNEAGNCLNVQHQIATGTMAQEKFQNGQGRGSGSAMQNGDARMLQNRSCDQDCDQDQDMIRNMTRDQIRMGSDYGLAGKSQGAGSNGNGQMLQNRSCDQDCDQDQDMIRNMTRDQIRMGSESVQQQNGTAESVQTRFGITRGNGQDMLAGFADQVGARFRYMGGIFQTLLQ